MMPKAYYRSGVRDISNIRISKDGLRKSSQISLEQNYRSNPGHPQMRRCRNQAETKNSSNKTPLDSESKRQSVTLLDNFTERDEAQRVADYIRKLNTTEGFRFNEIAILYRTNYQSRVLKEALRRKDLPYQLVGGRLSFISVKSQGCDCLPSGFWLAPTDEEALLRVINEPARGIGLKSLQTLVSQARLTGNSALGKSFRIPANLSGVYKPAQAKIRESLKLSGNSRTDVAQGA